MQNTRVLVSFLIRAVVVGLAVAFLVVWWNPTLLGAHTAGCAAGGRDAGRRATRAQRQRAPQRQAGAACAPVVMQSFADSVARAAAGGGEHLHRPGGAGAHSEQRPFSQLFGDYWPSYRQRVERSLGSGVIVDAMGTIVTNQHVIAGADSIRVQLADGRIADATHRWARP